MSYSMRDVTYSTTEYYSYWASGIVPVRRRSTQSIIAGTSDIGQSRWDTTRTYVLPRVLDETLLDDDIVVVDVFLVAIVAPVGPPTYWVSAPTSRSTLPQSPSNRTARSST